MAGGSFVLALLLVDYKMEVTIEWTCSYGKDGIFLINYGSCSAIVVKLSAFYWYWLNISSSNS